MTARIKSKNEVDIYEIDGSEVRFSDEKVTIESHWNRTELVLVVVDNKKYAVVAADLIKAIENATNV